MGPLHYISILTGLNLLLEIANAIVACQSIYRRTLFVKWHSSRQIPGILNETSSQFVVWPTLRGTGVYARKGKKGVRLEVTTTMVYTGIVKTLIENAGASEGDMIAVDSEFNGILMPHPGSSEPDTIIVKLGSGYNVGIRCSPSTKIGLVSKKSSEEKIPEAATVMPQQEMATGDSKKPKIAILHTGGTIASRLDSRTGGVIAAFTAEDLVAMFPELMQMANIRTKHVCSIMSESMRFSHYRDLAKEIAKEVDAGVDGIIVGHGTDTMHYTSAALSFMLQNLSIPVILVGAQRSSDRGSTDAAQNLINAAFFMANSEFSGVAICMHENMSDDGCLILPACKTRKMHTSRRDAFRPINALPWARVSHIQNKIEFIKTDYEKKDAKRKLELRPEMEDKVALVKTTTNTDSSLIDFFIEKKYKGLVLEGTGMGHTPDVLLESLGRATKGGMLVCMTSQTIYGRVNMNVYSPQRDLLKIGVIPCEDMLPETAFVKLSWLLGNFSPEKARELIDKNMRGEITDRTLPDTFMQQG